MRWVVLAVGALSGFAALGCSCDSTVLGLTREGDAGTKPVNATDAVADAADAYSESDGVRSHSGSRIDVVGFRAGDAETTMSYPSLHDTQKNVDCLITRATDGALRCLPAHAEVVYTDANCTQPIFSDSPAQSCDTAPKAYDYAIEYYDGLKECADRGNPVFSLGDPVDAPATIYVQSVFGCAELTTAAPGPHVFRAATPSPAGDWVRFEHDITKVTPKLGVASWVGSDGARLVTGAVLLPEGTACKGQTIGGSATVRCVPSDRLIRSTEPGLFGDDACTEGLAARCDLEPPALIEDTGVQTIPLNPCGPDRFPNCGPLFRVGREVDHSAIRTLDNACVAAAEGAILAPWRYYTGGAAIPFDDYPLLGEVHSGKDRLQEIILVSEEGKKLFPEPAVFYDTVARVECAPEDPLQDGRMFCVPSHAFAYTGGVYSDAACTRPLATSGGCVSAPVAVVQTHSEFALGDPRRSCPSTLRSITPNPSATPFLRAGATCNVSSTSGDLYDIGEPVDPGALFPELAVEPL